MDQRDNDVSYYLDRLQDTGISVLHSIFPFSHFWCPEIVPDGFSVMILYLRDKPPGQFPVSSAAAGGAAPRDPHMTSLFLRGPSKGRKGRLPVAAW